MVFARQARPSTRATIHSIHFLLILRLGRKRQCTPRQNGKADATRRRENKWGEISEKC